MDRLEGLRQPTIAALNGIAYGGGLEIALACDLRIAADHVKVAAPEVGIATVPGWGMTTRLAVIAGPARAKQMILTGQPVAAIDAAAWGVVSEVVPAADLEARTAELAAQIAAKAPVAVQVAKQLIDGLRPRSAASLEALGGGLTAYTDDAREGQAAFRERRTPEYGGS
jgi:enoyl-CoA hydratase